MRLLFSLFCLLTAIQVTATEDALYERLRTLVPGSDAASVNERQFLYQRVNEVFAGLEREEKVSRRSQKQRIRRIREHLATHYFREFRTDADLEDVLRLQTFNDAAASILLALCFERFDVTYHAYVDHWRVFVLAETEKRLERVEPIGEENADTLRARFEQDYVDALRTTLVHGLPELDDATRHETFTNNYYRPHGALTFSQLAAFSQYLSAQNAYLSDDYSTAGERVETALHTEDRTPFLVLLKAARTQLRAATEPRISGDLGTLYEQWATRPDNDYLPAAILNHFDEQQRIILAGQHPEDTESLLAVYLDRAPAGNEGWRAEMRRIQQLRLVSHYHKSGYLTAAEDLAVALLRDFPTDEQVQFLFGEITVEQIRRGSTTGPTFHDRMAAAAEDFPFLREHERFIDLYLRDQALTIRDLYAADRPDLALPALDQFRASLLNLTIGEERSLWTLTAFTAASYHHFLAGDYAGAMAFIEEGLRYAPEDQFLLHRKEVLANYL